MHVTREGKVENKQSDQVESFESLSVLLGGGSLGEFPDTFAAAKPYDAPHYITLAHIIAQMHKADKKRKDSVMA